MNQNIAIGADVGGSHISCAAVDLGKGKILRDTVSERAVNNQAQAAEIISVWSSCVKETLDKTAIKRVRGIGFAMPGPFDYVKGISYIKGVSKYENLYGFNIGDAILSSIEDSENLGIRFMNDASSFAVGEAWGGKGAGYGKSMCITLGTGLGSAFIDNKIPVVDGPEVPRIGCVYHLPYKDSIADDYFTTRWFLGRYKQTTGRELSGVKELSALVSTDPVVRELFHEFATNLGIFLAPWLKKFEAEILIIGGNISHAYSIFGADFKQSLKKEGWSGVIEVSELKEDAAFLGSAYLFNDQFWKAVQHALPLM
jgi:glucokinase